MHFHIESLAGLGEHLILQICDYYLPSSKLGHRKLYADPSVERYKY